MNKVIIGLVALTAAVSLYAQTTGPFPGTTNLTATNQPQTQTETRVGTNFFTLPELLSTLTNLQMEVQGSLPVISSFNDTFDFISIVPNALAVSNGVSTTTANFGVATGTGGAFLTPSPGVFTITRDTLRQLLILQSDLEQVLAILNVVNGTNIVATTNITTGFTPGIVPGTFTGPITGLTNIFVSPLTNGFVAPLTGPTGVGTTNSF